MMPPLPCQVTADLNRYLAAMDEESMQEDMKEQFYQCIMSEKLDLLDSFVGQNYEKADDLMEQLLVDIDWRDIAHQIRVAYTSRCESREIWKTFLKKPLEDLVERETEKMYAKYIEIEKENRELGDL